MNKLSSTAQVGLKYLIIKQTQEELVLIEKYNYNQKKKKENLKALAPL